MSQPADVTFCDQVLRFGRYQDVLREVQCDLVCADPPYSQRTHQGHDDGAETSNKARRLKANGVLDTGRARRSISYEHWTENDVEEFVAFWVPRCRGWLVALTDSELWGAWRAAFEAHDLVTFQPVPILIPGMTVRLCGDGPSSWAIYACVARPRREPYSRWGTLPGGYTGTVGQLERGESAVAGAKPLWLARALVRDYSRPGDLVCDPTAGGGTTLRAAAIEGRRAIGAEEVKETFLLARQRLARAYTPSLPGMEVA